MFQKTKIIEWLFENTIVWLLIVPLIPPQGIFYLWPALGAVWDYAKYPSLLSIVFAFVVVSFYRKKIDLQCVIALAFPFMGAVFTVINGESLNGWMSRYLIIIISIALISIYKNNLVRLLKIIRLYLEVLVITNLFFVLRYPTGVYETQAYKYYNWFLGYKSSLQCYVMPLICVSWLESMYSGNKIHFFLIMMTCFIEALLCQNMMLVVGMSLILIFSLTGLQKKTRFMNAGSYLLISAIINVLFIGFNQIVTHFKLMQTVLLALGKTDAISGRTTVIWPKALEMIQNRPLLGYGVYSTQQYVNIFNLNVPHVHNQCLQTLLDGGILLFSVFSFLFIYTAKKMTGEKDRKSTQIVALCTFVILLMATVEIFTIGIAYFATWIVLFLGLYTKELDQQYRLAAERSKLKHKGRTVCPLS